MQNDSSLNTEINVQECLRESFLQAQSFKDSIELLQQLGKSSILPLVRLVKDEDVKVRRWSTFALGFIGDKFEDERVDEPLIKALDDSSWEVREKAIDALGQLLGVKAIDYIIVKISDANPFVRARVIDVIDEFGDDRKIPLLINTLWDENDRVSSVAARSLTHYGVKVIEPLIESLERPDLTSEILAKIIEILGIVGSEQLENLLIKFLNHSQGMVRFAAVNSLGYLKSRKAVQFLIEMLNDDEYFVHQAVVQALGEIRDKRAVTILITLLDNVPVELKIKIVEALGKLQDNRAVKPLLNIFSDVSPSSLDGASLRIAVAIALGDLRDKQAVPILIEALRDSNVDVRWSAVVALSELGDEKALPYLQWLSENDYEEVSWGGNIIANSAETAINSIKQKQQSK